ALISSCSSTSQLSKRAEPAAVTIDGDLSEWQDDMTYYEDEKINVGLKNDNDYLYISLSTASRTCRQRIFRTGLVFKFDTEKDGVEPVTMRFPAPRMREGRGRGIPAQNNDPAVAEEDILNRLSEDIIFFDKNTELPERMTVKESGYKGKCAYTNGLFTIEIAVPLLKSNTAKYALGSMSGETLFLGIETFQPDMSKMKRRMQELGHDGGGMSGGGSGRRGGGMKGGGMGGRGGGDMMTRNRPEQMKLEIKVQLAK
ncbi:MAG: hypothetical protein KAH48_12395, partial [Chlorobi bacterium]|nr:hypothetical protein [Chlorobiota bacterium]